MVARLGLEVIGVDASWTISAAAGIRPRVVGICVTVPGREARMQGVFDDQISALLSASGEINGIASHYITITEIRPNCGEFRLIFRRKDGSCVTVTPG